MNIKVDIKNAGINEEFLKEHQGKVENIMDDLWAEKEIMTKWVKEPMMYADKNFDDILNTALAAQDTCGLFIIIGHEGSLDGIKAIIEACGDKNKAIPEIEFLGEGISNFQYSKILEKMRHYDVNVCVISRTGETVETLVSYRIIRDAMVKRYGEELAAKRTIVFTSPVDSTIRTMATADGSGVFDVSSEFAGVFSVFNEASLFALSVAGVDIESFLKGAEIMATAPAWDIDLFYYSVIRFLMSKENKYIELLKVRDYSLESMSKFLRQTFSETKGNSENFMPIECVNIQKDCNSILYHIANMEEKYLEEEIIIENNLSDIKVPEDIEKLFKESSLFKINNMVTDKADSEYNKDKISTIKIHLKDDSAFSLGQFVYFIFMTGTISGYLMGGKPFEREIVKKIKKGKIQILEKTEN